MDIKQYTPYLLFSNVSFLFVVYCVVISRSCADAVVQFTLRLNTYFVLLVLFLVLRCVVSCRVVLRLMSGVHVVVSDVTYSTAHVIGFSDLVDLWVTKIKKAYDTLCAQYVEIT